MNNEVEKIPEERRIAVLYWTSQLLINDDRKFKFAAELERLLGKLPPGQWCDLNVDYDPEDRLLEVVQIAGIECSGTMQSALGIFHFKHRSQLGPGYFRVQQGRGAERQYLVGNALIEQQAKTVFFASRGSHGR